MRAHGSSIACLRARQVALKTMANASSLAPSNMYSVLTYSLLLAALVAMGLATGLLRVCGTPRTSHCPPVRDVVEKALQRIHQRTNAYVAPSPPTFRVI